MNQSANTSMDASVAEGSFAQRWEEFVEDNKIAPEVAEKLQFVFYAGASSFVHAMADILPHTNALVNVNRSVVALHALQEEVEEFFEGDGDDDMSILTVKQEIGDV